MRHIHIHWCCRYTRLLADARHDIIGVKQPSRWWITFRVQHCRRRLHRDDCIPITSGSRCSIRRSHPVHRLMQRHRASAIELDGNQRPAIGRDAVALTETNKLPWLASLVARFRPSVRRYESQIRAQRCFEAVHGRWWRCRRRPAFYTEDRWIVYSSTEGEALGPCARRSASTMPDQRRKT